MAFVASHTKHGEGWFPITGSTKQFHNYQGKHEVVLKTMFFLRFNGSMYNEHRQCELCTTLHCRLNGHDSVNKHVVLAMGDYIIGIFQME